MAGAQGETVDILVHNMARGMVESLGDQREALNLIFIELVEFQGEHFNNLIPQFFPELIQTIGKITSAHGTIREIPPALLARTFFGLIFSFFLSSMVLDNSNNLPSDGKTLDDYVDIYLNGILEHNPSTNPDQP
jgi:hypothetical protein